MLINEGSRGVRLSKVEILRTIPHTHDRHPGRGSFFFFLAHVKRGIFHVGF